MTTTSKNKRAYDDRTDETLFVGDEMECIEFINVHLKTHPEDMDFIWVGNYPVY